MPENTSVLEKRAPWAGPKTCSVSSLQKKIKMNSPSSPKRTTDEYGLDEAMEAAAMAADIPWSDYFCRDCGYSLGEHEPYINAYEMQQWIDLFRATSRNEGYDEPAAFDYGRFRPKDHAWQKRWVEYFTYHVCDSVAHPHCADDS